jgi:hypothetical protein
VAPFKSSQREGEREEGGGLMQGMRGGSGGTTRCTAAKEGAIDGYDERGSGRAVRLRRRGRASDRRLQRAWVGSGGVIMASGEGEKKLTGGLARGSGPQRVER